MHYFFMDGVSGVKLQKYFINTYNIRIGIMFLELDR